MANTKSALKRVRQTKTRTAHNRAIKSGVKLARKSALEKIGSGDAKEAQTAYDHFSSVADKAAKNGVLHKRTADRLKSRMAAKLNAASTSA